MGIFQNRQASRTKRKSARTRAVLLTLLGGFALAASYTLYVSIQQGQTVERLATYDDAFDAAQGTIELMRLQTALAGYALGLPGTSSNLVEIRFWIVENRVSVLSRPSFTAFISGHPEISGVVAQLKDQLEEVRRLMPHLRESGVANEAILALEALDAPMTQLASITSELVGDQFRTDQERLQTLHLIFSGLMFALIAVGVLLLVLLLRDNRLVSDANENLRFLADNLRAKRAELKEANDTVAAANLELQLQNDELRSRDEALHIQNNRFDAALNNMSHGLVMVDSDRRLTVANDRFRDMFQIPMGGRLEGRKIGEVFAELAGQAPWPNAILERLQELSDASVAQRHGQFLIENSDRALQVNHVAMGDGGWVAIYDDITERRKIEAHTDFLAHHDALTQLPNRLMLGRCLEQAIQDRARDGFFALLLLDVDHFKYVNDTLGHLAGDTLLVEVARRLKACIGTTDMVARLGGDEFAILYRSPASREDVRHLAERIVANLGERYEIEGRHVLVSVSVGIAIFDSAAQDTEKLLRNADIALYRAKADGRATWRFFEPAMESEVLYRAALAADIRDASRRGELDLVFQPIYEIGTSRISQFEALLRWNHPFLGAISPAQFIPIAEETRLIVPIGEAVLRRACQTAVTWPEHIRLAVNLSPMQLDDLNFVEIVKTVLDETGLASTRLEFEITEGALLGEKASVRQTLAALRDLGVTLALDDFGTGYASLSYLHKFPFDKIKIDRSFVSGLEAESDSRVIVEAVISLASRLGLVTTAEGIERPSQWDLLAAAGCHFAQGYYLGRPASAAAVAEMLNPQPALSTADAAPVGLLPPASKEG
ncbi:putative bifunctional diguanylate cyclase/phosphodiesterase [Acidisoma sp. 7E03]